MLAMVASAERQEKREYWTKAFGTAYDARPESAFPVLTIEGSWGSLLFSSDGVVKLSPDGLSSKVYEAKITSWGDIFVGVGSVTAMALEQSEIEIVIADEEGEFAAVVYGSLRTQLEGSAAKVQLSMEDVDEELWPTLFRGTLDRVGYSNLVGKLYLKLGRQPLNTAAPKEKANTEDSPNLDPTHYDKPLPVVCGLSKTDGFGTLKGGANPVIWINTIAEFRTAFLTRGVLVATPTIFRNQAVYTSGVTVYETTIGGRRGVAVDFSTSQSGFTITWDTLGVWLTRDHDPINDAYQSDPLGTLGFLVSNFCVNDWAEAEHYDMYAVDVFDAAGVAAMRLWLCKDNRGVPWSPHVFEQSGAGAGAGKYFGREQESAEDLIATFAESYALRPYLTPDGLVSFASLVQPARDLYDAPWLDLGAEADDTPDVDPGDGEVVTRIGIEYGRVEVDGKPYFSLEVADADNPRGDAALKRTSEWAMQQASTFLYLKPVFLDTSTAAWSNWRDGASIGLSDVSTVREEFHQEDEDFSYIENNNANTGFVRYRFEALPAAVRVLNVTVGCRARIVTAGGSLLLTARVVAGTSGAITLTTAWEDHAVTFAVSPDTGVAWTVDEVNAIQAGVQSTAIDAERRVTNIYVRVEVVVDSPSGALLRDAASRELLALRRAPSLIRVTGPLSWARYPVFGLLALSHPQAPGPNGLGWGALDKWDRRYGMKLSHRVSLNDGKCEMTLLDYSLLNVVLWETDKVITSSSRGIRRPGVAMWCNTWRSRRFLRQTNGAATDSGYTVTGYGWMQAPTDRSINRVTDSTERYSSKGLLLEMPNRNSQLDGQFHTFSAGFWTTFGTGGGHVVNSAPTIKSPYDPAYGAGVVRITSSTTSVPTGDLGFRSTSAQTLEHNSRVMVIYRNTSGLGRMAFAAQRGSDSRWWNDSTRTWDISAFAIWNLMPLTGRTLWETHYSTPMTIPTPGTPDTVTVYVGNPLAQAAAGVVHDVGDVSVLWDRGQLGCACSPIHQGNNATLRATCADVLGYISRHGQRLWSDRGAVVFSLEPTFDSDLVADSAVDEYSILRRYRDDANYDHLFWDQGAGQVKWERAINGTLYTLAFAHTFSRGQVDVFALRWGTDLQEHGEPAWHIAMWINGVKKGSIATARPRMFGANEVLMWGPGSYDVTFLGGYTEGIGTAYGVPGHYSNRQILNVCPSDNEMAGLR